jgi:guanylate kinase
MTSPRVFVVSGPSGVGKSSIIGSVLAQRPNLRLSVSTTTRAPRPGEVEGREYHFVDVAAFERAIAAGGFLEWARSYDNYYGTGAGEIERIHAQGCHALLDVDTQGALQIQRGYTGAVYIFIRPPDLAALEQRLRGRGTESDEVILKRLARAGQEIGKADKYDYVLVNRVLEDAVREFLALVDEEGERAVPFTRIGNGSYDAIAFAAQTSAPARPVAEGLVTEGLVAARMAPDALAKSLETLVTGALRREVEALIGERLQRALRDDLPRIVEEAWREARK